MTKQREIKFRAWHQTGGIMLCHEDLSRMYSIRLFDNPGQMYIMQYTGLKDKSGKEIYEGDIVNILPANPSEAKDGPDYLAVQWENSFLTYGWNIVSYIAENSEVIGNIYENPEWLEAKS